MYEDENNLYHYSYRKGDEQNPNAPIDTKNYAEDPWDKNPGGSPKKKGGSGLSGKIVALALVCALVGGFIGAGVSGATTKVNKTSVQVSDREVAQVQTVKVDGKTQMSMSEVYASNVNSVVSINVSATTNYFGQTVQTAASGTGFFITEDGYMGTLSLQLDTVQVEVSGYGSSTREISATRSYPNLANQDTANIPKTIQDNGRTLTLQTINWQTDNTATLDGYALGDRFTAVATYTGSATSSYVKGYTVTADYTGTVGKINLDRVRYVAIFEGTPLQPVEEVPAAAAFSWAVLLVPIGMVALVGAVAGAALFIRHRREHEPVEENEV